MSGMTLMEWKEEEGGWEEELGRGAINTAGKNSELLIVW
jgi:hypothetical protein